MQAWPGLKAHMVEANVKTLVEAYVRLTAPVFYGVRKDWPTKTKWRGSSESRGSLSGTTARQRHEPKPCAAECGSLAPSSPAGARPRQLALQVVRPAGAARMRSRRADRQGRLTLGARQSAIAVRRSEWVSREKDGG